MAHYKGSEYTILNNHPYEFKFFDRNEDGTTDFITVRPFLFMEGLKVMPECPLGYIADQNMDTMISDDEFYINPSGDCVSIMSLDEYVKGMTPDQMNDDPLLDWVRGSIYSKIPK